MCVVISKVCVTFRLNKSSFDAGMRCTMDWQTDISKKRTLTALG